MTNSEVTQYATAIMAEMARNLRRAHVSEAVIESAIRNTAANLCGNDYDSVVAELAPLDNEGEGEDEDDSEDADEGDDLCDLCMSSGVNVDRTTPCGKTIGIECGCDESNEDGYCGDDGCTACNKAKTEAE